MAAGKKDGLAEVLASFMQVDVQRIMLEHTADASGHCRGCRFPTTTAPTWPCRLYAVAEESERLRRAAEIAKKRSA